MSNTNGNLKYSRLNEDERDRLSVFWAKGDSVTSIAKSFSRSRSTIYRELCRNSDSQGFYRALYAQNKAENRASTKKKGWRKIDQAPGLLECIIYGLKEKWSPQQISDRLKSIFSCDNTMKVSHESIYAYLYAMPKGELRATLLRELRQQRKRRRRKNSTKSTEKPLKDMILIDQRPKEVEGRAVPGHWEGDLLIGKNRQSALGVLLERKTRFTMLVRLKNRKAETIRKCFGKKILQLPKALRKSLTYDQGREMADHLGFTQDTGMPVFFAHPASPWEKGSTENTNGLLLQYFPKGTNFNEIKLAEINFAQNQLNRRPRAVLQYLTPAEVLSQVLR